MKTEKTVSQNTQNISVFPLFFPENVSLPRKQFSFEFQRKIAVNETKQKKKKRKSNRRKEKKVTLRINTP